MRCDEPGCTGHHDTSQRRRPYDELCPRTKRSMNRRSFDYQSTVPGSVNRAISQIRYESTRRGTR